eukprot:m.1401556 g.1401556  ORF g.1401556 m.1401556 type:complete len:909 (+) comp25008_c0_seq5:69-2795(+)
MGKEDTNAGDSPNETAAMDVDAEPKKEEKKKDVELAEAELSEEDQALKEKLEGFVDALQGSDESRKDALEEMRTAICASTSTMTSVPKPLKFLRPHFTTIKEVFKKISDLDTKAIASDVVSLLAMTQEDESRDCLHFRLTGSDKAIDTWGHEYVRHLSGEIAIEFNERITANPPVKTDDILALTERIVPYYMQHNAEADACDLTMEVDRLELLVQYVDKKASQRVCLYLLSCVPFVPEPQDSNLKKVCLDIFLKFDNYPQAMQMALKLNNMDLIQSTFVNCTDKSIRRQLAFMLARQQIVFDLTEVLPDEDYDEVEVLTQIMSNMKLNESFLALARELDIMEPKTPEDVYKTHLESSGRSAPSIDSARANLASTYVNAFVNAGFGQDKLVLSTPAAAGSAGGAEQPKWIHRNKGHGQFGAAASLGLILMWDIDDGLQKIDKYSYSAVHDIKGGALLAIGMVNAGVTDENDPALALLSEYVEHSNMILRLGAVSGLGLAYAGSDREDVSALLLSALVDPKSSNDVVAHTAVALGQIHVGTCNGDVSEALVTLLEERSEKELATPHSKMIVLGLGLLYLGKQQEAEVTMQSLVTISNQSFQKMAKTLLDTCAYAGTGNVLKIQELLHACSEHVDPDAEGYAEGDANFQAFATLGLALVAMGEDTGTDMAMRMFNHLLRYGEPVIRRAVPLAIALLCTSNPKLPVLDTLSKLSHDADAATVHNAILAIGLVGAGTNHARIANTLRMLAQYYNKDANALFMVRIAQGIVHAGKGSISLSPFHTDRSLMSNVAISGLLSVMVAALDMEATVLGSGHHVLFHLCLAMHPRILCTFMDDDELTPLNTSVRVGQAVDVVGQAGNPNTITGFVTNNTPVLLGHGERAQLATDEFLPLTPLLEGFVIVKKNPDFEPLK